MNENTKPKKAKAKTKRHVKRGEPMLTMRQAAYVHGIAQGLSKKAAALAAGYAPGSTRSQVFDLENNPKVRAELEKTFAETRKHVAYDAAECFKEAGRALAMAEKTRNASGMVKATELRARLYGLLVDKQQIEVATVDIRGALESARARVTNLTPALDAARQRVNLLPACDPANVTDAEFADASSTCDTARSDGPSIPSRVTPHMMPNFNR